MGMIGLLFPRQTEKDSNDLLIPNVDLPNESFIIQ